MKRQACVAMTAFLLLAGCGRGEERAGQPSAEENEKLNSVAAKVDDTNGTVTYELPTDSQTPTNQAAPPPADGNAANNAATLPAAPAENQTVPPATGVNRAATN